MARPTVKDADFVGKAAYLRSSASRPPVAILCTLTVDDPTSSSGVKRYMLGREPILTPDGQPLVDAKGRRSYVTSAGSGPSVGKHLLMSYLPPDAGGRRDEAPRRVLRRALPGDRRRRRRDAAVRPRERADPELTSPMNILVCVKRVPADRRADRPDRRRRRTSTPLPRLHVSPHEECAVEEAVRIVEAQGGVVGRPDARARPRPRTSSATRWRSGSTGRSCSRPTAATGIRSRPPARSSRRSARRRRPTARST